MSTSTAGRVPRTALIHDFLVSVRGADRVFLEICNLWPDADVFTPVYNERGTEGRFADRNIHTSFLQRLQPNARNFRAFLPLYPAAIEAFDLSGYDLVISSSSAWAHAVICDERAVHVSYCHNPFRYAWNERHRTLAERSNPLSRAAQNYYQEANACIGIMAYLDRVDDPLVRHEHLSQRDEELMHFMEGKFQIDFLCGTAATQKPVEDALGYLLHQVGGIR